MKEWTPLLCRVLRPNAVAAPVRSGLRTRNSNRLSHSE